MFDVHLTTIKVIDIENNKVVIDSTFGEKEYVLDKIKNGVKFELPKYKSTLQYQEKNDICYVFTNNQKRSHTWLHYYYALHSALPNSLPSLKLRAFSIVTTAIACKASRVKNAW